MANVQASEREIVEKLRRGHLAAEADVREARQVSEAHVVVLRIEQDFLVRFERYQGQYDVYVAFVDGVTPSDRVWLGDIEVVLGMQTLENLYERDFPSLDGWIAILSQAIPMLKARRQSHPGALSPELAEAVSRREAATVQYFANLQKSAEPPD